MNRRSTRTFLLPLLLLGLALAAPAHAQQPAPKLLGLGCGIGTVDITRNTVHAGIDLVGIVGTELVLEFGQVQNLNTSSLGLCARLIGPLELLAVLARLPDGGALGALQIPLPVMISVEPPAGGGLAFTNTYRAEIHTEMLGYTIGSPYRLYKAPHNGTFYDITNEVAPGSVRTRGTTGGFSDFLIVLDLIPDADHAADKYDYLAARIQNPAIGAVLKAKLAADLAASRAAFESTNYSLALLRLDQFVARVRDKAGNGIPNLWRAQRDRDNIAGDLIGYGESLRFSIQRAQAGAFQDVAPDAIK